jgi:hypothetical protein
LSHWLLFHILLLILYFKFYFICIITTISLITFYWNSEFWYLSWLINQALWIWYSIFNDLILFATYEDSLSLFLIIIIIEGTQSHKYIEVNFSIKPKRGGHSLDHKFVLTLIFFIFKSVFKKVKKILFFFILN